MAGFTDAPAVKDPAEFIDEWQSGAIPDTAENAGLAMDALALRNVMDYTFAVV